jgi:hypothetical protein
MTIKSKTTRYLRTENLVLYLALNCQTPLGCNIPLASDGAFGVIRSVDSSLATGPAGALTSVGSLGERWIPAIDKLWTYTYIYFCMRFYLTVV